MQLNNFSVIKINDVRLKKKKVLACGRTSSQVWVNAGVSASERCVDKRTKTGSDGNTFRSSVRPGNIAN